MLNSLSIKSLRLRRSEIPPVPISSGIQSGKTKLLPLLIFIFLMMLTTSDIYSQKLSPHHHHKSAASAKHISGSDTRDEKQLMHISSDRSITQRPVNETDSFYDVPTLTWNYDFDATHIYYQTHCLDSMITRTISGGNDSRDIFQYENYPPHIYESYDLTQTWNGAFWENSFLYEIPAIASVGCFYQYLYDLSWNGANWDTIIGSRRTTQLVLDAWNNPTLIARKRYFNNVWTNYQAWMMSFNAAHRLQSQIYARWDTTLSQFVPLYRDTNYVFSYYNSLCDYSVASFESQLWNGTTFVNDGKEYLYYPGNNREAYWLSWNGTSYSDSSYKTIFGYDNFGNSLGEQDYVYDTASHAWVLDYYDWNILSYDAGNNVIRSENQNNLYSTPDSIFPNTVARFSNFIPCTYTQGVNESLPEEGLNIYPNPATNQLAISNRHPDASGAIENIEIYDALGQKVYSQQPPKESGQATGNSQKQIAVDVSQLSPGIYFVKLSDGQKTVVKKVVKM